MASSDSNYSSLEGDEVIEVPDPIFQIRDLNVAFKMERGQARVARNIDIDIDRNEILGIVGESGSGKSMFASALMDAIKEPGTTSGQVRFDPSDGKPVDILELSSSELKQLRWEQISMVFQGAMSSFNPVRTIRDHFVDTLNAHDYDKNQGLERAADLLSQLHLDPERVLDSYPHELSGGMSQRVLIALSLILDPEVLVMDEPTAALDLLMQRSIVSLVNDIQQEHDLTIIFITHDLPLVAGLADRIAVMYGFEFVELGPADEIMSNAVHPYSRSLLNATPNLTASIDDMQPIEGESPDPVNTPSGCSYHPRCPLADELCRTEDPEAYVVNRTHTADCHHWEKAQEEVPAIEIPEDTDESLIEEPDILFENKEPLLKMDDVKVHFQKESKGLLDFGSEPDVVPAVDGVSLDVYENDVVMLVGESGCGKTTLGKSAVALQRPTDGSIEYRGQDIWQANDLLGDIDIPYEEIRRSLQIIHQDPGAALNSHRQIRPILETPLKRWYPELNAHDRKARIVGLLNHVGMSPAEDYLERYPFQLSGGEQQRVAIIRALLMNPDLILADEAVSALDVSLRVEMMDLLLDLQEEFDTSFLCISHDLSNARYLAEKSHGRIAVMYLGKIIEIGTPDQIINDPRHPYTWALKWATPDLDAEVSEEDEEPPIRGIDIPDPSDPPTGCPYHTRCPEAREACVKETPELVVVDSDTVQQAACFREYEDHEYWQSPSITDDDEEDGML